MPTNSCSTAMLCHLLLLLGAIASDSSRAQHVHGQINLGIVQEEDRLAISLEAPLADFVGFEHAPNTKEQHERLQQAADKLWNADAMFALPKAANCNVELTEVEGPEFLVEMHVANDKLNKQGTSQIPASADDHDPGESHDDDSEAHIDHGDDHGNHADINAHYVWHCSNTDAIVAIGTSFVHSFASIENIRIQLLTPAGTRVTDTEAPLESIPLKQ